MSIGLIAQKVHYGIRTKKVQRIEEKARTHLNQYLFCDISEVDPTDEFEKYEKILQPHIARLKAMALPKRVGGKIYRRLLLSVMLDISPNIAGETKTRLIVAFHRLGFVDQEIRYTFSSKWWIRATACKNLRLMNGDSGVERLVALLNDTIEDVRIEAALSLVDIVGAPALSPILLTITDISPWMEVRLSKSILNFGSEAIPHLAKGLKSQSVRMQKFCMQMLGDTGEVYAVPIIIDYLDFEIPEVRNAGIVALGKLGDESALQIIVDYTQSENEQIRLSAAQALGKLSSPATADVLNRMLLNDTIDIRLAAAESLTKLGDIGIKTLTYSAHSGDEQTRKVALQFLHELGYPDPSVILEGA
jgi:hypothetical protein